MGKTMSLMLLLLLQATFFTVFSEDLETLPPTSYAPHPSPPTKSPSPVHPPAHPPHHHHHHHHSPAPAPAPTHSHTPSSPPTLPPKHHHHHHYPPAPAPSPVHTPASPPALPPKHHHYPPAPSPVIVKPPVHPPVVPAPAPAPAPAAHPPKRPTTIPRSFVAVQGVVYLKSCKYSGVDTLVGATPLLGAVVKLQCNNTKYKLVQKDVTDKNGYFFIEGPKNITTYGVHKCNVVLVTAPNGLKPSKLHGGLTGAVLRPEKPFVAKGLPFVLYTVGPLAFEPRCPH